MSAGESFTDRLSSAAAQYRHDGDARTAVQLEAILNRLDFDRPVRVVDLDAAEELVNAKLGRPGIEVEP